MRQIWMLSMPCWTSSGLTRPKSPHEPTSALKLDILPHSPVMLSPHVNFTNRMNGSDRQTAAVPAARHCCAWPRVSWPSVGEPPARLYKNTSSSDLSELCLPGSHPAICISGEVKR
jgi:hypothetical protein